MTPEERQQLIQAGKELDKVQRETRRLREECKARGIPIPTRMSRRKSK